MRGYSCWIIDGELMRIADEADMHDMHRVLYENYDGIGAIATERLDALEAEDHARRIDDATYSRLSYEQKVRKAQEAAA